MAFDSPPSQSVLSPPVSSRMDRRMQDVGNTVLRVAVIGAGFGGIGMGAALKRAGISDFVIFDGGDDVGGVWRDNTYPGCSCDVPSHLYSLSVAPYRSATTRYPRQPEILDYLRATADNEGLRPHLRLNTAIVSAAFCDETGYWTLTTAHGQRYRARTVVWAVGQLHRPYVPDVPGRDVFAGAMFHSARWNHNIDLRGRRVAVVGTGSSAAQLIPEVAGHADRLMVFQRTPAWVLPKPAAEFGPVYRRAFALVPGLQSAYRAAIYYGADLLLGPLKHRGWSARPAEWVARAHLRRQVKDPALRAALRPDYPIGEKRILLDNCFYPALTRGNVELVTAAVEQLTEDGVQAGDGFRHADVVI